MEPELMVYCIRIDAHLDRAWSGWFEDMEITYANNGDTYLSGAVKDQAMLHGVLDRLHSLGLPLISVMRIRDHAEDGMPTEQPGADNPCPCTHVRDKR
jgi:hypothetical protein